MELGKGGSVPITGLATVSNWNEMWVGWLVGCGFFVLRRLVGGCCPQSPQWIPEPQPGRIAAAFADFHLQNDGLEPEGIKSALRAPSVLNSLVTTAHGFAGALAESILYRHP